MRKFFSLLLAVILMFSCTISVIAYSGNIGQTRIIGDVDGNGDININDYAMLKNYVVCIGELETTGGLSWNRIQYWFMGNSDPYSYYAADVNGDGAVDGFDANELEIYLHDNNKL